LNPASILYRVAILILPAIFFCRVDFLFAAIFTVAFVLSQLCL
jgi:hypothetical protein